MPMVQNVVATVNLEKRIDLATMATHVTEITYERDEFPAAILRTSEGPVCLIFSSGKIIFVGSKSELQLLHCFNYVIKLLKEYGQITNQKNTFD